MRDPEFRIPEEETVSSELQRRENLEDAIGSFDPLMPPSINVIPHWMFWLSVAIVGGAIIGFSL